MSLQYAVHAAALSDIATYNALAIRNQTDTQLAVRTQAKVLG